MSAPELLVLLLDVRPSSSLAWFAKRVDLAAVLSSFACAFKTINRYNGVSLIAYDGDSVEQLIPAPGVDERSVFAQPSGKLAAVVKDAARLALGSAEGSEPDLSTDSDRPGLSAALIRAVGFARRCRESSGSSASLAARVLEVHFGGCPASEFVALMNAAFCAERMGIMVDSLSLGPFAGPSKAAADGTGGIIPGAAAGGSSPVGLGAEEASPFNAYVAGVTRGLHHAVDPVSILGAAGAASPSSFSSSSHPSSSTPSSSTSTPPQTAPTALLQTMLTLFLSPAAMRPALALPRASVLDQRPASFDTGRRLDMGFVCTVCLAVFEAKTSRCPVCGSRCDDDGGGGATGGVEGTTAGASGASGAASGAGDSGVPATVGPKGAAPMET